MLYEAFAMQDQRILDNDDVTVYTSKSVGKSKELKVVNPSAICGEGDGEWQVQKAYRRKKKIQRIVTRELSKKDVMPYEEAKMVRKIMLEEKGMARR